MAIKIASNFDYKGPLPNFDRDIFDTIEEMKNFNENFLPDVFMAMNKEDGKMYIFNRKNIVDPVYGKWREVVGGGGASLTDDYITIKDTLILEAGGSN